MFVAALTQLYWLNFASITTIMEDRFHASPMSIGLLTLVFPLTYLPLSIPSGIIIDNNGFRPGVGIGAALTGIFSFLRAFFPSSLPMLLLCQVGISCGQPFVLNGVTKLSSTWFPKEEDATATGLGSLALFIGMTVGLGATPAVVESLGFEKMLLIYGIIGLIGSASFAIFAKDSPPTPPRPPEKAEEIPLFEGVKRLLKVRDFILIGFIALIGVGVFNGLATWLEKILTELHGFTVTEAGMASAVLILAGMAGCIVIPAVSDRLMRRKPFLILSAAVGVPCTLILSMAGGHAIQILNGAVLGFFLIPGLPIMLTMASEIAGPRLAGCAAAYLWLLGNGMAVAVVPAMDFLRGLTGTYTWPLFFLCALLLIGVLLSVSVRETGKPK